MTAEMRKQSKLFTIHRHKMLIIELSLLYPLKVFTLFKASNHLSFGSALN